MKETLLEKIQRKLAYNSPDFEFDEEFLQDLIDEAYTIIYNWRKLSKNDEMLSGRYDTNIIQYVIESINATGIEGQKASSANGISKSFYNTPEANLKSSISQRL